MILPNYSRDFYASRHQRTLYTADTVLSIILRQLPSVNSIVDVGCGVGTWLSAARKLGVNEVCGIDGSWVDKDLLEIPQDSFIEMDLRKSIRLTKRYDLTISLEVAEHLPPSCADEFVNSLVKLSDVVLFSAAIPHQGGRGHLNEQWQDYWVDLFSSRGYSAKDVLRGEIWHDEEIPYWYRQNVLLFVNQSKLPDLAESLEEDSVCGPYSVVHPSLYISRTEHSQSFRGSLRATRKAFIRLLKKHTGI